MAFRPLTRAERILLWSFGLSFACLLGIAAGATIYFSRDLPSMERLEMIEPALKTRIMGSLPTLTGIVGLTLAHTALMALLDGPDGKFGVSGSRREVGGVCT